MSQMLQEGAKAPLRVSQASASKALICFCVVLQNPYKAVHQPRRRFTDFDLGAPESRPSSAGRPGVSGEHWANRESV